MTQTDPQSDDILAVLHPSVARYWGALLIIGSFGLLLLWIAATGATGSPIATVLFLIFSGLSFYAIYCFRATRQQSLFLTEKGLFDNQGNTLCAFDQIKSLDRSFFAFKPSNGFTIRLTEPLPRAWVPGLWWRIGTRLGVGGITSVSQAKGMADTIALILKLGPDELKELHNPFAR